MRIISNWKDYYDSCLAYGADKSLVYKRKEKRKDLSDTYAFPDNIYYHSSYGDKKTEHVKQISRFVVGFCGNLYPALHVKTEMCPFDNPHTNYDDRSKTYVVYSVAEFEKLFPNFYNQDQDTWWNRNYKQKIDIWLNDLSWTVFKDIKKIDVDAYKKLFIDRKIPLFRVDRYKHMEILENCKLQDCGFHKVFDAFQTFQEIAMYQAGSLCDKEDPEMPVGNDVIVAKSKGYDKFSFRQDKGTKKNKRKLNKARKRNEKDR